MLAEKYSGGVCQIDLSEQRIVTFGSLLLVWITCPYQYVYQSKVGNHTILDNLVPDFTRSVT